MKAFLFYKSTILFVQMQKLINRDKSYSSRIATNLCCSWRAFSCAPIAVKKENTT